MNCPVCNVNLAISSREGVEIDYCPKCRGVWLDRGEIDKIIEKASQAYPPPRDDFDDDDDHRRHPPQQSQHPHGKKRGFLGNLLDWD